jgi:hypothetical protein
MVVLALSAVTSHPYSTALPSDSVILSRARELTMYCQHIAPTWRAHNYNPPLTMVAVVIMLAK